MHGMLLLDGLKHAWQTKQGSHVCAWLGQEDRDRN
jgi:hypothetical protein